MIAELLICGAALGGNANCTQYFDSSGNLDRVTCDDKEDMYRLLRDDRLARRVDATTKYVDPGWGECGYSETISATRLGGPENGRYWEEWNGTSWSKRGDHAYFKINQTRHCTERAWPVGVVRGEEPKVPCDCRPVAHLWHLGPRTPDRIQLVCPAGHLTTRKVKGEQK